MTHPALIERITRSLAYMLRHQPEQFDLELDEYGFADLDDVVHALNERLGEPVEEEDVHEAVSSGDRMRYEIKGDRIRALYGHSIEVKPGEPAKPPALLYVGVSSGDADRATRYGLRAGRRRFLHLALTPEDALETGRRAARDYVVITVHALDAWEEGINFYDRKSLFLSDPVPIQFLQVGDVHSDGHAQEDEEHSPARDSRGHGHDRGRRGRQPRDAGGGHGSSDRHQPRSWSEPTPDVHETTAPAAQSSARHQPGGRDPRREPARMSEARSFEGETKDRAVVEAQGPHRGPNRGPRIDEHAAGGRHQGGHHAASGPVDDRRHDRPQRPAPDARPSVRRDARDETRSEPRSFARSDQRPEHRPEQRFEPRTEHRPEQRSEQRPEQRTEHRPMADDRPREDRGPRRGPAGGGPRRDAPRVSDAPDRPRERSEDTEREDPRGIEPRAQGRRDSPPQREHQAESKSSDSFGLGLFEQKPDRPRPVRPTPPAPRARPELERPAVAPKPEPDDSGFGAGI